MTSPDLTLNVTPDRNKVSPLSRRQAALIDEIITLTGDEKSRRRYEQLAGIVLDAGVGELWRTAYTATEARLKKSSDPPASPGAYFCGTLTKLLEGLGLYVPVGTPAERDDVRAQIALSLGYDAPEGTGA